MGEVVQHVAVHRAPEPFETEPGSICPNCKIKADFSSGRCPNCGYIFRKSMSFGAHHEQNTSPPAQVSQPGQDHFTVHQQLPGVHDSKLDYSCPRCSSRLDPSSGRCPNCGYMGSMEYEIPSKNIPGVTPSPERTSPPPRQQSYNVQQFQQAHQSAPQRTCPQCGSVISADSRICPFCGSNCGTGRGQVNRQQSLSTLERANIMAASAMSSAYAEPSSYSPPVSVPASHPGYQPSGVSQPSGRSIPISDRTLGEDKKRVKREKVKDRGRPSGRKAFPMGLMAAIVIVAVLMIVMVVIVIRNEMSGTSLQRELKPPTDIVDTTAPSLSDIKVTNVMETGATIKWTTDEKSTSEVQLCLGDSCLPIQGDMDNLVKNHSVEVTDLDRSTTYHVTVYSKDSSGNEAVSTSDITFTTGMQSDVVAPLIDDIEVTNTTDVSAVITWTTNENATSQVEYGKTSSYGKTSNKNTSLTLDHSVKLTGLEANTLYYFRVLSEDSSGNLAVSDKSGTFTTLAAAAEGVQVGNRAPDFDLDSLDGRSISLSEMRGKMVMLNFWALTCAPCLEELPYIQDVEEQWSGDEELVILTVNYKNDPASVQDYIDIQQYTFDVLLDTSGSVGTQYGVNVLIPKTYFIDTSGVIYYKKEGSFSSKTEIMNILDSMD
jgi:peroxiredoxin/DNA-directed RNA polymerase subunit M/transcription elongation factor TFIIS